MCSPAQCPRCGKATWRGCGRHVDAVMANVPVNDQCSCPPKEHRSLFQRLCRT